MLIVFLFVCSTFLFVSCEKESPKETILRGTDLYWQYLLVDLKVNLPIDLNFDGRENTDLTKETDVFQYNDRLGCTVFFAKSGNSLTIAWPEPRVGYNIFLLSEIPDTYDGQDVKYFVIPRYYVYDVNFTRTRIYLEEIENDNDLPKYYTFTGPNVLEIDKEQNTITFHASQVFLTQKGKETREITAVFKPDPADNYFQ